MLRRVDLEVVHSPSTSSSHMIPRISRGMDLEIFLKRRLVVARTSLSEASA